MLRLTKLSRECRVDAEDGDQKNGGGKRPHLGADWRGGGRTALASSKQTDYIVTVTLSHTRTTLTHITLPYPTPDQD